MAKAKEQLWLEKRDRKRRKSLFRVFTCRNAFVMSFSVQQNTAGDVPRANTVDADARKLDEAIGGGSTLDKTKVVLPAKLSEVIIHFHLE